MTDADWAADQNHAALAHDDHNGPTIDYPGLRICAAVLLRPQPVLAITVQIRDRDAAHGPSQTALDLLPAHTPVELLRDDNLVHRDTPLPRATGLHVYGPHLRHGPGQRRQRRAVVRSRTARLARMLGAWAKPRDEEWEQLLEWAHRVNHASLAYNFDDAGPTIEFPGLRIFVCVQADRSLAINVWTKDTDEDSSLATPDDLPAHIPVELSRDDQLVHRDAPIGFGEQG
ncbi:hypothetical protein ABH935_007025 [Catenulispora sp. GAS73]|uniref:hypothetical protein n=1 Tax=Catenulispora sp. GAS73 TaxID=3156269 RepID=UPI0035169140